MRKLASIQKITALRPIEGADRIVQAEILGWKLIVKKDEFQIDDLCVYVEIDSLLPEVPAFEFLRARNFRIKTLKMRGKISQGIAFPLKMILEVNPGANISDLRVDDDVTDLLGVVKYELPEWDREPAEPNEEVQEKKSKLSRLFSEFKYRLFGMKKRKTIKGFPEEVPKTDETRVQSMPISILKRAGMDSYVTEKVEGCSAAFISSARNSNWFGKMFGHDHQFLACSRNRVIYNSKKSNKPIDPNLHHILKVAVKYDLESRCEALLKNRRLAIQGEVIGPKIQANIYRLPDVDLRVFLIYDIDKQSYLPLAEMQKICEDLEIPMAPILEEHHQILPDVESYVKMSRGFSQINPTKYREGIVIRSHSENFSFKSVDPEYLLKQED